MAYLASEGHVHHMYNVPHARIHRSLRLQDHQGDVGAAAGTQLEVCEVVLAIQGR